MTDLNDGAVREQTENEPEPEQVSDGYAIVLFDVEVPPLQLWRFVEKMDKKFFVKACEPEPDAQKRIQDAGMKIDAAAVMGAGANRAERRAMKRGGKQTVTGGGIEINANAAFVQKCIEQITDFFMPTVVIGEDHKPRPAEQKFNPANGGDNGDNTRLYEILLKRHNRKMRELVEDYLDWAGGRSEETMEDFNDLGNAR